MLQILWWSLLIIYDVYLLYAYVRFSSLGPVLGGKKLDIYILAGLIAVYLALVAVFIIKP